MHKNLINWLALLHVEGVGPIKFKQYLQQDPCLDYLPAIANKVLNSKKSLIELHLKWSERNDCHIILLCEDRYPKLLKNITDPPPILFVQGDPSLISDPQIAIVGSRKASKISEQIAGNFASELANLNIVITSGLALGIDTASHIGAMSCINGKTIAVLGNGLNLIYPRQNIKLFDKILSTGGAIVSEFPLNTGPLAANFPRRNRVISGLSLATLVIEASTKSGSLITANYALEQGKEVFVVPGYIYDENFRGCHKLIKQGAKLVENIGDILEDLRDLNFNNKMAINSNRSNKINNNCLDELQNKVLHYISYQTTSADLIINRSGLMTNIVNAALVNLELSGYISSVPGGYVKLI